MNEVNQIIMERKTELSEYKNTEKQQEQKRTSVRNDGELNKENDKQKKTNKKSQRMMSRYFR
jgi:hypothetical protein